MFKNVRLSHKGAMRPIRRLFCTGGLAFAASLFLPTHLRAGKISLKGRVSRQERGQTTYARSGTQSRFVYTSCLGCNARCGMRAQVQGGTLVEVSGNPYHPYNSAFNPIDYTTPSEASLPLASPVCGKAKEAPNILYNPYRLLKPLKRSGARGTGKFEPIEWAQLITEVAEGGQLFKSFGDQRYYPGLRAYMKDDLIDPAAPELGTVRNQVVFIGGRDQAGYKEFTDRFIKDAFGSINRISHTDICGLGFRMGNFALTDGKQVELKADPVNAEYILVFGANIYEALQPGINTYGATLAARVAEGKLKFTIVDPRSTNASVHAHRLLPVKPGEDGALAMCMLRRIIETKSYDVAFLRAPNASAAAALGRGSYTNATHLVICEEGHPHNGRMLRWSDLQLEKKEVTSEAAPAEDPFVVLNDEGGAEPHNSGGLQSAELDAEARLTPAGGTAKDAITVKTAFRIMKEELCAHRSEYYAQRCGVELSEIIAVADEFSAYGHKAAVCQYHGAGNYPGGAYAAYAIALLNVLVGSIDMRGGYLKGGGAAAKWNEGPYDLKKFPGMRKPSGVRISREKSVYESSAEYARKKAAGGSGYPAERPWFAFTQGGLCVESLSGIAQQYPYKCGVLFTYYFNPIYSIPGGDTFTRALADPEVLPLHISIDVGINESNLYADYIVPALTYLEGQYAFLTPHAPGMKFTAVRTPVVAPLTGHTIDGRPFSLETFLIDLAKQLALPGFGEGALPLRNGGHTSLHRAEDYYIRGIANLAANVGLPEADSTELRFVEANYPVADYKHLITPQEWRQCCYLLARGGVFNRRYEDDFDSRGAHKYGNEKLLVYNERMAGAINSITGKRFKGSVCLADVTDSYGTPVAKTDTDYPLTLVTYKMNVHAQSRSSWHKWSMEVFPENFVYLHPQDARQLHIADGERVCITSRHCTAGVTGTTRISPSVRPGCAAISFHYGHTQLGASSLAVQAAETVFLGGQRVCDAIGLRGDPKLGAGILPNRLGRLDVPLGNTPLVDVLSGIPDFSSTRVAIRPLKS